MKEWYSTFGKEEPRFCLSCGKVLPRSFVKIEIRNGMIYEKCGFCGRKGLQYINMMLSFQPDIRKALKQKFRGVIIGEKISD